QWQDLGHHVIFLIGDGTGQAGDPSGKTKAREKFFSQEELRKNAVDYVRQAGKIVRFEGKNAVEILFNGDWLNKLTLPDILTIAEKFSLQQLSERDMFQKRMKQGESVNLREFLYPLLQAYDSVAMDVDLEIGGSDQTFNMLCGRTLMKTMRNKDKFVMSTPLLADSKGVKIGKTEGNVIGITDDPRDLFAKIMALPDEVIVRGFEYFTDVPMNEVTAMQKELANGKNPVEFKTRLALAITVQLHGKEKAQKAQKAFKATTTGQIQSIPMVEISLRKKFISLATVADVLVETKIISSKSEAKRVIEQGGVRVNKKIISDPNEPFALYVKNGEAIIQKGKTTFIKIKPVPI
ncbi:MAG: tyrosine--tRNA ligase, partial [Candidatus Levybacteria bacterium RIFCSPLOWO2_01_FULL_42_15]